MNTRRTFLPLPVICSMGPGTLALVPQSTKITEKSMSNLNTTMHFVGYQKYVLTVQELIIM